MADWARLELLLGELLQPHAAAAAAAAAAPPTAAAAAPTAAAAIGDPRHPLEAIPREVPLAEYHPDGDPLAIYLPSCAACLALSDECERRGWRGPCI